MSHAIMVPVTGQGTIVDNSIATYLPQLLKATAFPCTDVYLYSHGWWTTANAAMVDYSRFSVGLLGEVMLKIAAKAAAAGALSLPTALEVGIHWPSVVSEDSESPISVLQPLTFYNRAAMADDVGEHGGMSILRLVLEAATKPLRIRLIGHSFGCRVICSTLVELLKQVPAATLAPHSFDVVLLQGAFDTNAFEAGQAYGSLLGGGGIPNLRLLITKSAEDKAVGTEYPLAYRLIHLFGRTVTGMGATGPSPATPNIAGVSSVPVSSGFPLSVAGADPCASNFVVADLTPLHRDGTVPADGFSGHHSDIYRTEIYRLITRFFIA